MIPTEHLSLYNTTCEHGKIPVTYLHCPNIAAISWPHHYTLIYITVLDKDSIGLDMRK